MFIFILVLMVLNLSKVLLKPTIAESELDGILVDDETRSKRQTQFSDLLHQSLEKYENGANEQLAPLRALPNYKQYETFVYPKAYSQPAQTFQGNAAIHNNKPNLKCSKMNLCSIAQQQTPRYNSQSPKILVKSQVSNPQNSKDRRGHFPNYSNGYVRLPMYGSNQLGLRNRPPIYNPQYSHMGYISGRKNFTYSALNRSFYDKLLYRPIPANRHNIVRTPIQNTKPRQMLASEHRNATPVSGIKSCTFSKVFTEKTLTNISINKSENPEIVKPTTKLETPLSSKQNNTTTTTKKPKNCSCLKNTTAKPPNMANLNVKKTSTEANSPLGILYHNTTSSGETENHITGNKTMAHKPVSLATNYPQSNQNLKLVFLQLDTVAHNENKEDLKQILKKLNALKSALNITEYTTHKMESKTEPVSSTTVKTVSTIGSPTIKTTTSATLTDNIKLHQAAQLNYTNIDQSQSVLKTNNCYIQPNKSLTNATVKHTLHSTNNSGDNTSQLLTALKDLNFNLNTSGNITAITSSQLLQLNISSSKELSRTTNEMNTLVSCITNKTTQENSQQHHSKSIDGKAVIKDQLKNINLQVANSNDTLVLNHVNLNNNGSTINSTISFSISSNGCFKKIKGEQQSTSDKHLEINEKENMNLSSSKVRTIDTENTDSRYEHFLKKPQTKDPYAEPISSEIYSSKSKLKTKPPLSIYWHRIEEKPLNLKKNPSKFKNKFHLDDYDDDDKIGNKNVENLSTLLKECVDYKDLTESQEAGSSKEIDHKPRFRDKCKNMPSLT